MEVKRSGLLAGVTGGVVAALAVTALGAPATSSAQPQVQTTAAVAAAPPTRVVFIVLDQLRPEFIDAFDMVNTQALIDGGAIFPGAYLGHMASETVISHNVMTSGRLPKNMGWSDEWYRDVDGLLGPAGDMYVSGSMSQPQFDTLISARGYPKLADYLEAADPDKVVATIGEKNYAVHSMGGPGSEIRITFGSRTADCDGDAVADVTWRGPTGTNVPAYIAEPVCGRYYVDSDSGLDEATGLDLSYGTATTSPAWMYPVAGNRDVPGVDPAHLGGDIWVTDAAFDVMDNEDWSGLLLTYGGIDKAGHMWGGLNDVPPYPGADPAVHMAELARVADEQVGRVMAKLEADGLADETLVVLTTDHAQLEATNFYGIDGAGRGNLNWYYGTDADEDYTDPQPEIQRLIDETGENVRASMQASAIRTWLIDTSFPARRHAADVMATLGGVKASYFRSGNRYVRRWVAPRSEFTWREWRWFRAHAQEIVNTAAAPYGPDVIGLLGDDTSYGVAGDHGGAQESVQRIPIVFSGPGVTPGTRPRGAIRSVDIMPTILSEMGIEKTAWTNGRAYRVP